MPCCGGPQGRHQCQAGSRQSRRKAWVKALTVVSIGEEQATQGAQAYDWKFGTFHQALGSRSCPWLRGAQPRGDQDRSTVALSVRAQQRQWLGCGLWIGYPDLKNMLPSKLFAISRKELVLGRAARPWMRKHQEYTVKRPV